MRNIIILSIGIIILCGCNPTIRTALNINRSKNPQYLNISGSYTGRGGRFYFYNNNVVIKKIEGTDSNMNLRKNQNHPSGYGWYFIDGDKITFQFYVRGEGSPYVIVES